MFIDRFNQFIISSYKKDSRFRWISNSFGLFHCSRLKQMPLLIVYGKLVTQKLVTYLPEIWRYRPVYYHWFICARILQVLFFFLYIYKIRLYIFGKMGTLILLDVLKHWRIESSAYDFLHEKMRSNVFIVICFVIVTGCELACLQTRRFAK